MLETVAVNIGKVLNFELFDKVFISLCKIHLSEGSIGIYVKPLEYHIGFDDLISHVLINKIVFGEAFYNHLLFLPFRRFNAENCIHLVDVKVHRLLIKEGVLVEVKFITENELLGMLEFLIKKIDPNFRICNYL